MSQQHGRHLAEDIVKHIFLTEKFCSSIQNSLKSVPKDSENKSELVRVKFGPEKATTCHTLVDVDDAFLSRFTSVHGSDTKKTNAYLQLELIVSYDWLGATRQQAIT